MAAELTRSELAKILSNIRRAKDDASEASGEAGALTKSAAENFGVDGKGLTWVIFLSNLEPAKRNAVIRSFLTLSEAAGFFDQADLFDDLPAKLGLGIGAVTVEFKGKEAPLSGVMDAILSGA